MGNIATEVLNKANGAAHDLKSKVQSAEYRLEKMSHTAGEKVGEMASDLIDTTSGYVKTGREYVQENPGKSVAIAAAAGVVAGSLFTVAMRRRNQS